MPVQNTEVCSDVRQSIQKALLCLIHATLEISIGSIDHRPDSQNRSFEAPQDNLDPLILWKKPNEELCQGRRYDPNDVVGRVVASLGLDIIKGLSPGMCSNHRHVANVITALALDVLVRCWLQLRRASRFGSMVSAVVSNMKTKGEVEANEEGGYRLTEVGRHTWSLIRQGTKFREAISSNERSLLSVQ
jgi:hypothetical protein